jgi:hypothetical protein
MKRASEVRKLTFCFRRLICGGRRCVGEIRWRRRVKQPICEDAHADDESNEKRKPCRGVIPNGLRIAAFCPLRSVQFLGCHHMNFPTKWAMA